MSDKMGLIRQLEADIEQYDQIFLATEEALLRETVSALCSGKESGDSGRKRLVLIPSDTASEGIWDSVTENAKESPVRWKIISPEEAKVLYRLYDMYEFSDRFHILSREEQYGGMLNFVDTGLLSAEEMLDALLH